MKRITNINHQVANTPPPYSLFLIELEPRENNRFIYTIKTLLIRVILSNRRSRKRPTMPQYKSCQAMGTPWASPIGTIRHGSSSDCPREESSEQVKFCNCDGLSPCKLQIKAAQSLKRDQAQLRILHGIQSLQSSSAPSTLLDLPSLLMVILTPNTRGEMVEKGNRRKPPAHFRLKRFTCGQNSSWYNEGADCLLPAATVTRGGSPTKRVRHSSWV